MSEDVGAFLNDPRVAFIGERVCDVTKLKLDRWEKCLSFAENRAALSGFLEEQGRLHVAVYQNKDKGDELTISFDYPPGFRKKSVVVLKLVPGTLDAGRPDWRNLLRIAELGAQPLEQLKVLLGSVYLPLIHAAEAQNRWPRVVVDDMIRHFNKFQSHLTFFVSQTKGTVQLLIPRDLTPAALGGAVPEDKHVVHAMETCVIEWSKQIRKLLEVDSAKELRMMEEQGMFPGPLSELDFWAKEGQILDSVQSQLESEDVVSFLRILTAARSSFMPGFVAVREELTKATVRCKETVRFLETLRDPLGRLADCDDVRQLPALYRPILHTLMLIWKHSKYFSTPVRMVTLLRKICNDIIRVGVASVDGTSVLKQEIPEALDKLDAASLAVSAFKRTFFEYKGKVNSSQPDRAWRFENASVFGRLDAFLSRIQDVHDLVRMTSEFTRLEKVEIGGVQGQSLTSMVDEVRVEFLRRVETFQSLDYDIVDLRQKQFDPQFELLVRFVKDLDQRLCFAIQKAFEDCASVGAAFKIVDTFETQAARDTIRAQLSALVPRLIQLYDEDLNTIAVLLFSLKDSDPQILFNLPRVAGTVAWARSLLERASWPLARLRASEDAEAVLQSHDGKMVVDKFEHIASVLKSYETDAFSAWSSNVENVSLDKLNEPLLRRNGQSQLLEVNFDFALASCIQEVKYLHILSVNVPQVAESIFGSREEFRQWGGNLALITAQYNSMMKVLVDVERPLVRERMDQVDEILSAGLTALTWKSEGIAEFTEKARTVVRDLYVRVNGLKGNLKTIEKMLSSWCDLFRFITAPESEKAAVRSHNKFLESVAFWRTSFSSDTDPSGAERLSQIVFSTWRSKSTLSISCTADVYDHADRIHKVLAATAEKLEADVRSNEWQAFLAYQSGLMAAQIRAASQRTLETVLQHLQIADSSPERGLPEVGIKKTLDAAGVSVLIESKFFLQGSEAVFSPAISETEDGSLQVRVMGWIDFAAGLGRVVKRPDDPAQTFGPALEADAVMVSLRDQCVAGLRRCIAKLEGVRAHFMKFGFLVHEEKERHLAAFLRGELFEGEKMGQKPTLADFDEKISHFGMLLEKIQGLTNSVHFGWIRIDCQPMRTALLTELSKWRHIFLSHLEDHVQKSVLSLGKFIQEVTAGLAKDVPPGNYERLVQAMDYLFQVRSRQEETDAVFDPLREMVLVLRKFGRQLDEDVVAKLETLPDAWSNLKKVCVAVKERLAPLQVEEVQNVHKAEAEFTARVDEFRRRFLDVAPFRWAESREALVDAYDRLDRMHMELTQLEKDLLVLNTKQNLFELMVNQGKVLKESRADIRFLKTTWDIVGMVVLQLEDWKGLAFLSLDTSGLEDESKKFYKEIRNLDKKIKAWDVYRGLENLLKNFLTSLPLVTDLRSPSMRDRHWTALMKTTGVKFVLSEDFKLADLLALELHKFVDDVQSIVERANKELSMEKSLRELTKIWATLAFEFGRHKDTDLPLIKVTEEIIETLEDHQVQLQNMSASKYIAIFQEEVELWQRKLSSVDSVIALFVDVQRTWAYLENIFIGSEDIRRQLPEDSKRFENLDASLKALLKGTEKTPKIIDACCKEGLEESLSSIQESLSKCEKSLSEYLETKRKAFPRFYFVSVPDLLDILSKGGQSPHAVMSHMPKLFQAIQRLEFEADAGGKLTDNAIGMVSREGEYVAFRSPCNCSGQVEMWLTRLVSCIRDSLNYVLEQSVNSYVEKNREAWLLDFPAQIVLLTTQIFWSSEVNAAFEVLEEGNENAIKDYNKKQILQLHNLIKLVQGDLSKGDRMKVMCQVTLDVHARDIVQNMIRDKTDSAQAFAWQSQLRPRWDERQKECYLNICDAEFVYGYEYLGNGPRLVITPLTDRIYITATQSLHLIMGCAPAGPAGTGKTETTKDLGSQMGKPVYVFNCSDQMDYKSLGNIFKGLASSGAWGCFDEFNRIAVEVLSVVSTQFKSILDAVRESKSRFNFQGEEIALDLTCGAFITMNPGYLGRTELPESLKALFRPVTVVVPDLELICENMLMAEGFVNARVLAKKFITLYSLCRDLLSKQDHYDWGLRAIKSVLVVAGSLRRGEPHIEEEKILMRALRDFNLPKIVSADLQVFMGLINDLFPGIDLPRKRDLEFEKIVKAVVVEKGWQAEDGLVLKVVQLEELLQVRHSVFVLGPAGTGKSVVWKSLASATTKRGRKTTVKDLNPKAITSNELYGYINPSTREWEDGLLSSIMRDLGRVEDTNPKWLMLDGDLDTEWIESMNSVMDDNKILTLASNERIPLLDHMRLMFEIAHLKYATPATVSRAGILFVSELDIGWNPYLQSWCDRREDATERTTLVALTERYVVPCLSFVKKNCKTVVPISDINMIESLCFLLDSLLPQARSAGADAATYELICAFSCIWAFGSPLSAEDNVDYRQLFSKWWRAEFKSVKFPESGTVFDYYVKFSAGMGAAAPPAAGADGQAVTSSYSKLEKWSDLMPDFTYDPEVPLSSVMVPTVESTCLDYFMDTFVKLRRPVMLVGPAGCGKTKLAMKKLGSLPEDQIMSTRISFNYYTDARTLQGVLEAPLEKKAGRNFGPPGAKRLIYFIDDLNMPVVDNYGTQSPIALMRQHIDYGHWYDRKKLSLKDIHNCQYFAAMNPTAGSFFVNPRLQRHFVTFATTLPSRESLTRICSSIMQGHLSASEWAPFASTVSGLGERLVQAALDMHKKVSDTFLKTAIKFHYEFNLRHLSDVFQGLLLSKPAVFGSDAKKLASLWLHETYRVYGDRLVDDADQQILQKDVVAPVAKKHFSEIDYEVLNPVPNIFSHFSRGYGAEKVYDRVPTFAALSQTLNDALNDYNETNAMMNLVLFEDAMSHVCRISRIIENPAGHALLVGVGGSGKQSLSRLAAFISGYSVVQITISRSYGIAELKEDLKAMYMRVGTKNEPVVFLLTDSQIVNERFLVFVNDLLSSGRIPDLFAADEIDGIVNAVRGEVKQAGIVDTKDNCWDFFIEKVRRNLHVVLCFSPVGDSFRVRARKFPALVNCTVIDWFQPWPRQALLSVANRFLDEIQAELGGKEQQEKVVEYMAFAHQAVDDASRELLVREKRFNYTTPKSFLELISFYKNLLSGQRAQTLAKIDRLESGLIKLRSTTDDVAQLEEDLKKQQVVVEEKKASVEKLLKEVSHETTIVERENEKAVVEQNKCNAIAKEVSEFQRICEVELSRAEPAIVAAEAALNTLNKNNLTELKSFKKPPQEVADVLSCVLVLMSPKSGVVKDRSWTAAQKAMGNVDQFLKALQTYDKENIPPANLQSSQPYLQNPNFNGDYLKSKSSAAAGICEWAKNVVAYYEIYCDIAPKRQRLAEANAQLEAANAKLKTVQDQVAELQAKLKVLEDKFQAANAEKLEVQAQAERTQNRLALAQRLVRALASENVRWAENVKRLQQGLDVLVGDVLVAGAFVSYIGGFPFKFRRDLLYEKWIPKIRESGIPCSQNVDPLGLLTDDATIAGWNNLGLPADRVSVENGTILTQCERWPLIVDPQLQGISFVKNKFASSLKVLRLGQNKMLDLLENAIRNGATVLIENIGESIDAVLAPILSRQIIKKGRELFVRLGDKEVEYDPKFRLILQTKLSNPHYKPEIQAETQLINFMVTEDGLEEQLLALVVKKERPDLEEQKAQLIKQQNEFKIRLKELEDNLLERLSKAEGDILGDIALIENLEITKATSTEIEEKVKLARKTEVDINKARESYRPCAARGSLLYFLLDSLSKIEVMYQFSLNSFVVVFNRAIDMAEQSEDVVQRVNMLIDSVTFSVFTYARRGLFERHKLVFAAELCFRIMFKAKELDPRELEWFVTGRRAGNPPPNPLSDWLDGNAWASAQGLKELEGFERLPEDVEGSSKRWKEWADAEQPEREKLPQDWKNKTDFQKLMVVRALRPDRVTHAVRDFVRARMGDRFVEQTPFSLEQAFFESSPTTPMFFILFPGADPVKEVEALGRKLGFTEENGKFKNVSLGQGQEIVAEQALERLSHTGGWVMLQNIHLMNKWLPTLERSLESLGESAHKDFRVFLTAEPANHIPQGILQVSIKVANEAPQTLRANLLRAYANFNQDTLESCMKQNEFKTILFALCFFHALVLGRRRFGFQGWSRAYSFNVGDLTISANVLFNYLEANTNVPWEDIRYMFGEIMYGGHITDKWDRRTCSTYLETLLHEMLMEGGFDLAPNFAVPPVGNYADYVQYIEEVLPEESPPMFGLHPNAEINFLQNESESMFNLMLELSGGSGSGGGDSREQKVKQILEEILRDLPENFDMADMFSRAEDRTPYVSVVLQECDRMNILLREIRSSLRALEMGLRGELTISEQMERILNALYIDRVPPTWEKVAYPSLKPLAPWFADLLRRVQFLAEWSTDLGLPKSVWLSGLFNPMSFLTAVMQTTARKQDLPLDKMVLTTEVTKKQPDEISAAPREGAYIHGLFLEGARWDTQAGVLKDSLLKQLHPALPVVYVKAVLAEKRDLKGVYECPVYLTSMRGATYVFTAYLKTQDKPSKWVLAGVCGLMAPE